MTDMSIKIELTQNEKRNKNADNKFLSSTEILCDNSNAHIVYHI